MVPEMICASLIGGYRWGIIIYKEFPMFRSFLAAAAVAAITSSAIAADLPTRGPAPAPEPIAAPQ